MSQPLWTAVDQHITNLLVPADPMLDAALKASTDAGLPPIQVAANQGKLLEFLVRIQGAKNILELGTLGGYSTLWMARALPPDGQIITIEADPKHAAVAQSNFNHSGLSAKIDLRTGKALDVLPTLAKEGWGTRGSKHFDLIFIDADKPTTPEYFAWAMQLTRKGGIIITDNVIRDGQVANPATTDPSVQGVRRLMEVMAAEKRITATALQTVGSKGYDGFAIALVIADA